MKKHIIKLIILLTAIAAAALLLSLLGHFEIWIFSNSLNDNLFVAGGIVFAAGIFTQSNTSRYAKGMGVMYSGRQEKPENERSGESGRLYILGILTAVFAVICALSFLLPDIRI